MTSRTDILCPSCRRINPRRAETCRFCGHALSFVDGVVRYSLTRLIKTGGQAVIFEAIDDSTNRTYAIKEIMLPLDPEHTVEAFQRCAIEARLLATLAHPGIPRFYSCIIDNGRVYIVMDYVRGTDLEDMLRQRSKHFTLEVGAEGAINTVNNKNSLTSNGVPVFLPAGNVQIKEKRAELFGNLITSFNPSLSLETGLRYEMSEFTQRGDSNLDKSLAYLKPRALLTWKPTKNDELRFLYEREAGQLDFTNFIAFIQVSTSSVTSGNKNQVPSTQWRKEVAWEHRFGNSGSIVLTGRREEISDVLDRIALTEAGSTYDAPGNIGSGWREELQMDMILPLDWTGVKGFTLQGTALYRVSGVTDPTNGMRRRISNDAPEEGKLSLTHDIPAWKLRWGATYKHDVEKNQFRYNEIRGNHLYTRFDAFVEYKPSPDWLIRLIGRNMIDTPDYKARTLYVGGGVRGVAPVNYVEQLPLTYGPGFGINIQKTFGG